VHAHCTTPTATGEVDGTEFDGAVTFLVENLHETTTFFLDNMAQYGSTRWQYQLTSDDIYTRRIFNNGAQLVLNADRTLPEVTADVQENGSDDDMVVTIPPLSVTFLVFPKAGALPCTLVGGETPEDSSEESESQAVIIGSVVGVVGGLALVAGGVALYQRSALPTTGDNKRPLLQ
jgi:hypothetical protein